MDTPFPKTWWVEPGRILAGCYPGTLVSEKTQKQLLALLHVGIRSIICLQEETERGLENLPFVDYLTPLRNIATPAKIPINWARFPIPDRNVPSPEQMSEILKVIQLNVDQKKGVYIHCWGGHGRTGTVVGCWLVQQGLSGNQALARIKELREKDPLLKNLPAPQTFAQRQMILRWAEFSKEYP